MSNELALCLHKIDWVEAEKCEAPLLFAFEVCSKLEPLFSGVYDDTEMIGDEIDHVAAMI